MAATVVSDALPALLAAPAELTATTDRVCVSLFPYVPEYVVWVPVATKLPSSEIW